MAQAETVFEAEDMTFSYDGQKNALSLLQKHSKSLKMNGDLNRSAGLNPVPATKLPPFSSESGGSFTFFDLFGLLFSRTVEGVTQAGQSAAFMRPTHCSSHSLPPSVLQWSHGVGIQREPC